MGRILTDAQRSWFAAFEQELENPSDLEIIEAWMLRRTTKLSNGGIDFQETQVWKDQLCNFLECQILAGRVLEEFGKNS